MLTTVKTIHIGENRGKPRIWLEGIWLHDLGFTRGSTFACVLSPGPASESGRDTLTIFLHTGTVYPKRTVSGKDRGDKPNPIIDLSGEWLRPLVSADRVLTVTARRGRIVITKGAL